MNPPKALLPALLSRLKIMANLDIAIRFEPQDGKFQIKYENRSIDFRLSTLHTNDAVQAVTRLVDMGIDPYLVSSSVILVAAQRLVRKLCEHCRVQIDVPRKELLAVGVQETELGDLQLYGPNAGGCPRCKNGYRGRMALLETLPLSQDLKRMVVEGRSVAEMKNKGLEDGMLTLRRIGVLNAMRGKTSLEEVLRITMGD